MVSSFQQRLSYNTLGDLALSLIDGTVYEIVQGLLDIQHLTEKNLYNQRQKLHCEHQGLTKDLPEASFSQIYNRMKVLLHSSLFYVPCLKLD